MRPSGAHNPCASNKNPLKEQIRCISAIRVPLNPCCRRVAMNTSGGDIGTVLQTAATLCFIDPETSSRVTLASLGIAFQANLIRSIR